MILETVRSVLAWCCVIDLLVLLWWAAFFMLAHDWTYRQHSRWFNMSVEQFDMMHYGAIGVFKLGILIFNLGPYLALRIVV